MDEQKTLMAIAVVAVVVSVVAAGFTYFSIANFVTRISGYATGTANLTVETTAQINFTTSIINWGSGRVNQSQTNAVLDTLNGSVVRGNWTAVSTPLTLENQGNVNLTLNLSAGKTAATFIGGTNPSYRWYINSTENGSCRNSSVGFEFMPHPLGVFANPNTTSATWCPVFGFSDSSDTLYIHFNLTIPSDSFTGALGDIITATAVTI